MTVGCLGDIVFYVSSDAVKTLNNFTYTREARTAVHQRHGASGIVEYTGYAPATASFRVRLDRSLGISDVMAEVTRFEDHLRSGTVMPLVIGNRIYGEYRWILQSVRVSAKQHDGRGVVIAADVDLSLLEYTED